MDPLKCELANSWDCFMGQASCSPEMLPRKGRPLLGIVLPDLEEQLLRSNEYTFHLKNKTYHKESTITSYQCFKVFETFIYQERAWGRGAFTLNHFYPSAFVPNYLNAGEQ